MVKHKKRWPGICRACGCTHERPCQQVCSWVEADLCSVCAPRETLEGKAFVRGMAEAFAQLVHDVALAPAIVDLCADMDLTIRAFRNAGVAIVDRRNLERAGVQRG